VAGDGALTIHEIAQRLGKKTRRLPSWLLRGALSILKPLGLTQYGPEQLDFLALSTGSAQHPAQNRVWLYANLYVG
jgi:hypothetical protein